MADDHPCDDELGYGGSKYLMEEMTRLVSRQNPSLDLINLRISGIIPDDSPPVAPPSLENAGSVVAFCRMYMGDMLRCLQLAIENHHKPGVRVLNAVDQYAVVPDGVTVASVLRGWWGADAVEAIPGLAAMGDGSVFDTRLAHKEIGFLAQRRVAVAEVATAKL